MTDHQSNVLILLLVMSVTLMAFLGVTLFNTKGEPREAIVAVSMLQQGEWILPINYGADMPYKPPMLAWLIAAVSWLCGGEVTEFTSRVPSALACIVMVMMGYGVFNRFRRGSALPMAMAVVTFTAFEVERAATSCRVDMVFTAGIVCAIYFFYNYFDRRGAVSLVGAVVSMAVATLTKGPAGVVLPCMVIWVWRLTCGDRFWQLTLWLALCGVLSLIPYVVWWLAAMSRGGDEFVALMIEENFGRFTGTMSYSSHSNGVWYYFPMLAAGFLPYTLLALFGLFVIRWRKPDMSRGWVRRVAGWYRRMPALEQLSMLTAVLIFVFYLIPDSKRGVYILPIYPFIAWFMAKYMRRLCRGEGKAVRAYGWVLASISLLGALLLAVIKLDLLPEFNGSLGGIVSVIYNAEIEWWQLMLLMLSAAAGVTTMAECCNARSRQVLGMTLITTVLLYWAYAGVYGPMVLNSKSLRRSVESFRRTFPQEQYFYSFGERHSRLYEVDYYMDGRMRLINKDYPDHGILIGASDQLPMLCDSLPGYEFDLVWLQNDQLVNYHHKSPMAAWRFVKAGR